MATEDDPISLFRNAWTLYDAITSANYMFHRELYAHVAGLLGERHRRGPVRLLDLGCGNARFLASCLRQAPPRSYDGVDLSPAALEEARHYLSGLNGIRLHEQDLLQYVTATANRYDLIFSGYAIHHLAAEQKESLLRACAACAEPDGEILMMDVLREEGQDREGYLEAYLRLMRDEWTQIPREMIEEACAHVAAYDQPASLSELSQAASSAGWVRTEILERHGPHHLLRFSRAA